MTQKEKNKLLKDAIKILELIELINKLVKIELDTLDASIKYNRHNNSDCYHSLDIYNRCIVRLNERYRNIIFKLNKSL